MTQRTNIQSLSGAVIAICATLPPTYDQAGYEDTDLVFVPIGKVENYGNHGLTATITKFTPVDTATVEKIKGSKDYGVMSMMFGNVPGNAGQVIVAAASESNLHYSVKITYPLGDGESTAEVHYLDVLVGKLENQDGTVDNVRKLAVDFEICKKPVVVAAS